MRSSWLTVAAIVLVLNSPRRIRVPTPHRSKLLGAALPLLIPALWARPSPAMVQAPREEMGLAERAEALEAAGKWTEAAAAYEAILKIDPRSLAALNNLGRLYVNHGRFQQGVLCYRRALKISPGEFVTNLNLGIAYVKVEDYKPAVPPLERAVGAEPGNLQARTLLAVALIGQDDYAQAVPHLEQALELAPDDLGSAYLLIRAYLETKQFDKAQHEFQRLEALAPSSPWMHILKGQAYDGEGAYSKAVEEFEAARREVPADATVRFSLGFMYWKLHRYDDAEGELAEALKLDPRFDQAKFYLADTYLSGLKPERALPLLQDLARKQPGDYRIRLDLGKVFLKMDRSDDAVRELRAAIHAAPTHSEPHYLLARAYQNLKRAPESRHELEIAQQLQADRRAEQETLLNASGERGDPSRSPGLAPATPPKSPP